MQGVLLYGPPGTGKTLLARAVAHHTDCTFIRVSGSELVQKYIGEGSRMVRELFVMARYRLQPSMFETIRVFDCNWTRLAAALCALSCRNAGGLSLQLLRSVRRPCPFHLSGGFL